MQISYKGRALSAPKYIFTGLSSVAISLQILAPCIQSLMKANEVTPLTSTAPPACPSPLPLPPAQHPCILLNIFTSPEGQLHASGLPALAPSQGPADPHVTTEQAEGEDGVGLWDLQQAVTEPSSLTGKNQSGGLSCNLLSLLLCVLGWWVMQYRTVPNLCALTLWNFIPCS